MLKDLLREAEEKVIIPLQNNDISKTKLKKNRKYFFRKLSKIWKDKSTILVNNKFDEKDIFDYPLEVIYFLNVSSKALGEVIQEEEKFAEYLDFFLENYLDIKFKYKDIQELYRDIKNLKN